MLSISVVLRKYFRILLFFFIIGCHQKKTNDLKVISGYALGTSYSVTYVSKSLETNLLITHIDSIIKLINKSMSTYEIDSDISKINRGDSLIQVDIHFQNVYKTSSIIWKKTEGYFDPTVGALVNAYGFGPEKKFKSISKSERDKILKYTGWNKTSLTSKNTIQKKDPNIYLDFNALAKGYTVDLIADHLRKNNVNSFLVEIGGEIVAQGKSPRTDNLWKVAIDDPKQGENREFIRTLSLKNQALATSGNYRKYKIDERSGRRIVHSVNPKTGNPFPTNVLSTTVISNKCMIADAYATSLMVMPYEKGKALVDRELDLEAFWIIENEDGSIEQHFSKNFPRK